jgi:uncharacterized membrane protein
MAFLSRVFIKGLITLLPITLTIALLIWVVSKAEWAFGEPLRGVLPPSIYFPGIGVAFALIAIFMAGLAVNNYLTNQFVDWLETRVERVPIIKSIYAPIRDVTQLFSKTGAAQNQSVVMVKLSEGVETMGLITREKFTDLPPGTIDPGHVAVFLPFSYGVGGFTIIVARTALRETSLSAEKALQLSITGWVKSH